MLLGFPYSSNVAKLARALKTPPKVLSISHTSHICSIASVDRKTSSSLSPDGIDLIDSSVRSLCGRGPSSGKTISSSSTVVNENNQLAKAQN